MYAKGIKWSLLGLPIVIIGIWLDEHGHRLGAQLFVMTSLALLGPIGVGILAHALKKHWFWVALLITVSLHVAFHWSRIHSLPLQSLGAAILLGAVEACVLAILTVVIQGMYSDRA